MAVPIHYTTKLYNVILTSLEFENFRVFLSYIFVITA